MQANQSAIETDLETLRHDCAHLLAQAVKELYPAAQVAIGPAIEQGFYYDFAFPRPLTADELPAIEQRMREIVGRREPIRREAWSRAQADAFFAAAGERFKQALLATIPEGETISVYRQGEFTDLCRGPHGEDTGQIGLAFKLLKLAGAYWRGDHCQPMLQRIYGTVWPTQTELDSHLKQLEEAELRDHRRLGRDMDLFHFQEQAPGSVFWHPKGWRLFQRLIDYLRQRQTAAGYQEINTPDVMDIGLWQASGHWEKFGEHMFTTRTPDERVFALKPMNCPGGVQVFKQGLRSYRQLPLRLAEFGKVHRYEPSGALHGLMRVRSFTQDDAHVFCSEQQITQESLAICELILSIYRDFGFHDIRIKFSDRPLQRVGSDAVWDQAEQALIQAMQASGLPYTHNPGEGAFYGPKLEFVLRDAVGRDWQCGTLQVDLNLPGRLGASYIDADGNKQTPVMLHRALFGSLERFTGILLEHYAGWLPFWLVPLQIVVAPISEPTEAYALAVADRLSHAGLTVESDLRNEKIGYKIREHSVAKVPLLIVVGQREMQDGQVTLRWLHGGRQQTLLLAQAVAELALQNQYLSSLSGKQTGHLENP
ncbi:MULTISPECIES: threonine--tRNA ligase [Methylomicrobium]|uniref:Threonine--tRNA ligase n=1 Tax=Methylomicrobium album BG8 TaxID=686340 RepID=H8GK11_METAL|nr:MULTISPECIES: threonine--tRNA ligase [Methylomicrobium]EIC27970.1 threonyl-tRNA synthetase [Methylomicrobium album BG8]